MADINLLQGSNKRAIAHNNLPINSTLRRSGTGLLVFILILVLLEGAAYGGLWYYRNNTEQKIQETESAITEIDAKLADRKDKIDKAVSAQARTQTFDSLLSKHIHWTAVWDELAAKTLAVASFVSMEADTETNQFKVHGSTATFSDLGKLLLGLETSKYFKDIAFNTATVDEQGRVGFDVIVTFDAGIFNLSATNQASALE